MKYYENYIPSYILTADLSDPITCKSIRIKFYDKSGQTLMGVPPEFFESRLDFYNVHNPNWGGDATDLNLNREG